MPAVKVNSHWTIASRFELEPLLKPADACLEDSFGQLPIITMRKANPGGLDGCRGEESDLVRLERLHGANSNLSDPVLRTSSNLSTVMQHWKPMPQEVVHPHFMLVVS